MLSRRELIAGGAVMTQARAGDEAAQRERDYSNELQAIHNALVQLQNKVTTADVNQIRDRQRQFYRINQRFPECVDVGIRVWERMEDWHIANGRVLTIQRAGDSRWQMDFIMSVLVLKHELADNEVGQAYDR